MGFGWSSYVAQSTMVSSCLQAGFQEEAFLSDERLMLPSSTQVLAVATDDVNLFETMSVDERSRLDVPALSKLGSVWASLNLEGQSDKALDGVGDAKVLGVELVAGTRLQSRGAKLWDLMEACMGLMKPGRARLNKHRCSMDMSSGRTS